MSMDDIDGQMIFGDLVGLKLPDICLTDEEKHKKKPHLGNLSQPGIEPGPAAWQARMLPLAPQRWTEKVCNAAKEQLIKSKSNILPSALFKAYKKEKTMPNSDCEPVIQQKWQLKLGE